MSDYGISKVLPKWGEKEIKDLLQKLENYSVSDADDLQEVTVDVLVDECGMKELQANKLYKAWQRSKSLI